MIRGLYQDKLEYIEKINTYYKWYEGDQKWSLAKLDYVPAQVITNYIKNLIDIRARFMFGIEPFIDVRPYEYNDTNAEKSQEIEDLIQRILKENKWHKKLMSGYKDSLIAGNVGIKLWAHKDKGLRIIFVPAQEYFIEYSEEDIDDILAVTFFYFINDEVLEEDQRARKQRYYLEDGICYLDEEIVDGFGQTIEVIHDKFNTSLDFIPFINITNGGLTGEVEGTSEVEQLMILQDYYNKLSSDDVDALQFQMFGQTVFENASTSTLENIQIAPGAIIDFQKDRAVEESVHGSVYRLESSFSYSEQLEETLRRFKGSMFDLLNVPNISTEQLKGVMSSGKSMKTLYWNLIAACDEDWAEWNPALTTMTEYILKMVQIYNLYDSASIIDLDANGIEIEKYYPIQEDEVEQKRIDMDEVVHELRSKSSYMDKWGNYEDVEGEIDRIKEEIQTNPQDTFSRPLLNGEDLDEELTIDL